MTRSKAELPSETSSLLERGETRVTEKDAAGSSSERGWASGMRRRPLVTAAALLALGSVCTSHEATRQIGHSITAHGRPAFVTPSRIARQDVLARVPRHSSCLTEGPRLAVSMRTSMDGDTADAPRLGSRAFLEIHR